MIKELTKNPYKEHTKQSDDKIKRTIKYLNNRITPDSKVLDVGQRSPLTDALESYFNFKVDNTEGDLDEGFDIPAHKYDVIIYSHTIEHQFNPLLTLFRLKLVMGVDSMLYIFVPCRGKLLWTKHHYHEIDTYRMNMLAERAGFKIISTKRFKVKRPIKNYIGLRPLLRLFFEYNKVYVLTKKEYY